MRSFKLFDRLLGRSAAPEQLVAGVALGALQAELETGKPAVLPLGSIVVDAPKYPEAERIAASIRDYPEDWGWARKGYDLIHIPSGFRLWVANEDYGLAEVHPNNGKTNFAKPEQAIIWPAVAEWLGHRKAGFTGRPVRPRLRCRDGSYWCESTQHPWVGVGYTAEDAYQSWLSAVSVQAHKELGGGAYIVVQRRPQ